jgi:flagellar biosynthesis protein FliR
MPVISSKKMKSTYKLLLIGCLTIGIFDSLASIASKQFNFNYVFLAAFSFIIYGTFGFIGTRKNYLKAGVSIAAAIGFFDSTIGWEISMLLEANTGKLNNDPSAGAWIVTVIFVTASAALTGLIGAWLAKLTKPQLPIEIKS